MYHRNQVKYQLFRTETERVAFFHCNRIVGNAVKTFYHIERFGISYDFYLRISTFYGSNRCGVIGFHVVDNKVIDRAAIQNLLDIVEIGFGTTCFYRIDKRYFFIDDQIGVVRDAVWKRPKCFEFVGLTIICSHIVDVRCDFS